MTPKRPKNLTKGELDAMFTGGWDERLPPILTPSQVGELFQVSVKTIYEWIAKGRLDGTFRKRGKHVMFLRQRVVERIFNGPEWKDK